ncbi:Asp/Glu/hydantoin racemase (plasmid) [Gemmatirosa kalamazoonensis]|uniref:Maleate isomerase n=1 Tax=Gemmatirosa kalamazoonensis TaxID=861299 RepID=W0RQQ1_9BACT|nr:aspartate/glutamate racemase family protein [Gemmatirosa kalamazoonensis]AHG92782.1 Asp/Glu/hydantoin racemase [Gemmatirosa kalamazoonensis]
MSTVPPYRVGLIVPSSNVTMETEVPALLRAYEAAAGVAFTFHGARMRMKKVTAEALLAMDREGAACAAYLADAQCDVQAYACLVAVMVQGPRAHEAVAERLHASAAESGWAAPIVTSAGALVDEIRAAGYARVALVAPYVPELTRIVVSYIEASAGVEVVDAISLSVSDNCEVGRLPQQDLVDLSATRLDVRRADAVVLSSCVQMPSLRALQPAEARVGLPCLSAAAATTRSILRALQLDPAIPGFGSFLARPAAPVPSYDALATRPREVTR